jgi:ABC-2 type transport system permease protein
MIGMFFDQLIFMTIGCAIAASMHRPKPASSITAGVLMATFFLAMGIQMSDNLGYLSFLSPFMYFDAAGILNRGFNPFYLLLSVVLIALFTFLTYATFRRKDLSV